MMKFGLLMLLGCNPIGKSALFEIPAGPTPVDRGVESDPALTSAVDALVLDYLDGARKPGLAVALYGPGEVLYTAAYGWADLETERAMTATTPILLSSVSKTFIGVTAMQGVEAGRLELDDVVQTHLSFDVDNPNVNGDAISLRDTLTHMSGIEDSREYDASYVPGDPEVSLEDFERGYLTPKGAYWNKKNYADRKPGKEFSYSNVAAALGALAIGNAADLEFYDLVERDVLGPLGMNDSAYLFAHQSSEPSRLHYRYGKHTYRFWDPYGYPTYPDGMLHSTANDIGRYGAMILGQGSLDGVELLASDSVDTMLTVDANAGTDEDGQAVVWALREQAGRELMGHNGGDFGSFTELWMDREAGGGVALLFNGTPMDGEDYRNILDLEDALIGLAAEAAAD